MKREKSISQLEKEIETLNSLVLKYDVQINKLTKEIDVLKKEISTSEKISQAIIRNKLFKPATQKSTEG